MVTRWALYPGSCPKDHSEIYVMDVAGGRPRQLITLSGANNGGPSWSRDGKWIYFYSDQGGGPFEFYGRSISKKGHQSKSRSGAAFFAGINGSTLSLLFKI